jgi:hypothetical protein
VAGFVQAIEAVVARRDLLVVLLTVCAVLLVQSVYLAMLLGVHESDSRPTDVYWAIRELAIFCGYGFLVFGAAWLVTMHGGLCSTDGGCHCVRCWYGYGR